MERQPIGVVHALYRYPVKSMQGERLDEVEITAQGVIGDRAYALCEANGRVMTAKNWPTLLECGAHYKAPPTPQALAPLRITLPDGRTIQAHDPNASAVLSTVLGRPVVLERAQPDQHHRAEINPATVFGDVPVETLKPDFTAATLPDSFALPPGTFFDYLLPLYHLLRLMEEVCMLDHMLDHLSNGREVSGCHYVLGAFACGTFSLVQTLHSLRLCAEEVMPAFS